MTSPEALEKWRVWLKEATVEDLKYYIDIYEDAITEREERNVDDRLAILKMQQELHRRALDAAKSGQQV